MTTTTPFQHTENWRALYVAALNERDSQKFVERVVQAQRALIRRARELFFMPDDHFDEEQAIDAALHALHTLRRYSRPNLKRAA